jgi:hypothetical protein
MRCPNDLLKLSSRWLLSARDWSIERCKESTVAVNLPIAIKISFCSPDIIVPPHVVLGSQYSGQRWAMPPAAPPK